MITITDEIENFALHTGIHKTGITSTEPLMDEARKMKLLLKQGFIPNSSGWNENKIDTFCSPSAFMPGGKSIIMAALCYYEEKNNYPLTHDEAKGKIALYTWRNNYKFLRKKLEKLGNFIKKHFNTNYKIFTNGPLAEKPLAKRAGLGYYGKNGILYINSYGSRIVLGGLIIEMALAANTSSRKDICGSCSLCIKNCPTGAIVEPYVVDSKKCFQYLGQHIYEEIPDSYRKLWGNMLYGCSLCQDICPINKSVKPVKEFSPYGIIGPSLPLIPLLEMSEKKFREIYKGNQLTASWVDFDAIRRNAILSIGNSKNSNLVPLLQKLLNDENLQVREIAGWAIKECLY